MAIVTFGQAQQPSLVEAWIKRRFPEVTHIAWASGLRPHVTFMLNDQCEIAMSDRMLTGASELASSIEYVLKRHQQTCEKLAFLWEWPG